MTHDEWVAKSERAAALVAAQFPIFGEGAPYEQYVDALAYAYREGARDGLTRALDIYAGRES